MENGTVSFHGLSGYVLSLLQQSMGYQWVIVFFIYRRRRVKVQDTVSLNSRELSRLLLSAPKYFFIQTGS